MGLILYLQPDSTTRVGVWKIDETVSELQQKLTLDPVEQQTFELIKDEKRQKQWLGVRVLLKYLLYTNKFVKLSFAPEGKPFLPDFPFHISLSHAGEYAAVVVSDKPAGIDIERINPRVEKITQKFTTPSEIPTVEEEHRLDVLYVIWCTKEAMFKLYGKGELNFIDHIKISPFTYASHGGSLSARIVKEGEETECLINYMKVNGYMVAYALDHSN